MKKYICVKDLIMECYDDDGSPIYGEYFTVEKGSIWDREEDNDRFFIGGEVRLEKPDNGYYHWIEITNETLNKYFKEVL